MSLVHEVLHSMMFANQERFLLKLDLSKDYGRVDWNLLLRVLSTFGLNENVCQMVLQLVSFASMAILMNGSPSSFFKLSHGLRQGDPLSLILFIIIVEGMGRMILDKINNNFWKALNPLLVLMCSPITNLLMTLSLGVWLQLKKIQS